MNYKIYKTYLENLRKIIEPYKHDYDVIYKDFQFGTCGGMGYPDTDPPIPLTVFLLSLKLSDDDKHRIKNIFNQINNVETAIQNDIDNENKILDETGWFKSQINKKMVIESKERINDLKYLQKYLQRYKKFYRDDEQNETPIWTTILADVNLSL